MEASRTLNARQMQCANDRCGSDGMFSPTARCPDCGTPMVPMLGECSDCGDQTESPEVTMCTPCNRYADHIDRQIDARDFDE